MYDMSSTGETRAKAMYKHEGPVLDLCWSKVQEHCCCVGTRACADAFFKDGSKLFSAGADKAVRAFDMNTQQNAQVAAHGEPVSAIRWVDAPTGGVLASGSWDKTLKARLRILHPIAMADAHTMLTPLSTGT